MWLRLQPRRIHVSHHFFFPGGEPLRGAGGASRVEARFGDALCASASAPRKENSPAPRASRPFVQAAPHGLFAPLRALRGSILWADHHGSRRYHGSDSFIRAIGEISGGWLGRLQFHGRCGCGCSRGEFTPRITSSSPEVSRQEAQEAQVGSRRDSGMRCARQLQHQGRKTLPLPELPGLLFKLLRTTFSRPFARFAVPILRADHHGSHRYHGSDSSIRAIGEIRGGWPGWFHSRVRCGCGCSRGESTPRITSRSGR